MLCNKAKHSRSPSLTDYISSTHHMKKMTQIWEHIAGKQMVEISIIPMDYSQVKLM